MLILGCVAELSAERRHRDIKCFGRAVPVLVPHLAHELISAHSRARVRGERSEQIELLRSQCHLVIVEVAPSGCEVDGERAKLENRVRRWGNRATAKMRPEAGEQHGQAERFDEIVISARVEADDDIDLAAAGGKDHEQSFRIVAADGAGQIDTVEVGKAKVQQYNFGRAFMDMDERGGTSAAPGGRIAVALETKMEMVPNSGIVFDNQHCRERERVRPAHAGEPTCVAVSVLGPHGRGRATAKRRAGSGGSFGSCDHRS